MSDVLLGRVIGKIKEAMNDHAHDAMQMTVHDLAKYGEIVGAYRGLDEALKLIDEVLRESAADQD